MDTTFEERFAEWLPQADISALRIARERLDVAIVMYENELDKRAADLERERKEARSLIKELGIEPKKQRKPRKDKGTKRARPAPTTDSDTPTDQVTE